ncbi:MAG: DoxX family protein [Pseudomonadota bacterium]|nr:DoxX family protein [Pseudomonadota bacterium]
MNFVVQSVRKLIALADRLPVSVFEFIMRLAVGTAFFRSGLVKIQSWDTTLALFRDEYKVPVVPYELAAYMATACELTMPVLLLVGLGTRFAAAAMFLQAAVIQLFVYPENWPDHILWLGILGYLIARGAGKLSLDYLIARRFK